jgi:hypothetical protein
MLKTVVAVVRGGRIELLEPVPLAEGAQLLVTRLSNGEEQQFWGQVSDHAVRQVWENPEDDAYAELLQR